MSIKNKWQVRSVLSAGKAALPFKSTLRKLKRRAGGGRHWPEKGRVYVGPFQHVAMLEEAGLRLQGRDVLEVGTGSEPVLPLVLRIAGARRIYLTDVEPLLEKDTLLAAIDFLLARRQDVATRLGTSTRHVERRLAVDRGRPLGELLAALDMEYLVPFEPGRHAIKVACIVSHRVFEHIPPAGLEGALEAFDAILKDDGLMSHGIDHSDHRANYDTSLSRIDFLKYNDTVWQLLSLGAYTNRLRHPDYVDMLCAAGYEICAEQRLVDPRCVEDAERIALHDRFEAMEREDVATLWSFIVAKPRGRVSRLPTRVPRERPAVIARPQAGVAADGRRSAAG